MPHFCEDCRSGADTWLCQCCGEIFCSNPKCNYFRKSVWCESFFSEHLGHNVHGNVSLECFTGGTQRSK